MRYILINPLDKKPQSSITISHTHTDIISEIENYLIDEHSNLLSSSSSDTVESTISNLIKERLQNKYTLTVTQISEYTGTILNKLFGYYILQKYIDDTSVTDIRTIDWNNIFVKRRGCWILINDKFLNKQDYINFVRYCVIKNNGKINFENPIIIVSDRTNSLRIEAGISPVNIIAPNLVIRIHRKSNDSSLEGLYMSDSLMMTRNIYIFLCKAILAGCNIIISGKGASGKTTLLRSLINKIPYK